MELEKQEKFGFVAICGAPNAGKSTLINQLVGEKVAAVSPKIQTTRFNILSVKEFEDAQVAFVDTPGLFKPKNEIGKIMRKNSRSAIKNADILLVVVDLSSNNQSKNFDILDSLSVKYSNLNSEKTKDMKFFLVFNKVDKLSNSEILEKTDQFRKYNYIEHFFMISALLGNGIQTLKKELTKHIPIGNWMYPPHSKIKSDFVRWAAELTMEKIFRYIDQEIPYSTYVEPLLMKEKEDGLHIYQNIIVDKQNHKLILVGKRGKTIKLIGSSARLEIAKIIKRRVHLHLFVKIIENWENKKSSLLAAGFIQ